MRHLLLLGFLLPIGIAFAQSDKDMIVASWKCVAVEQASAQPTTKKQKAVPIINELHIDTMRLLHVDVVYGFRNNGSLIVNKAGAYESMQYKVEGNTLSLSAQSAKNTTYAILELNYRTMVWQDMHGFVYKFEKQ